jgi:hypothetical protein
MIGSVRLALYWDATPTEPTEPTEMPWLRLLRGPGSIGVWTRLVCVAVAVDR